MKAVENTSPNFMRLARDMCSCVMTGRGKINMYKSKIMPSTDCTIPQYMALSGLPLVITFSQLSPICGAWK